MSERTSARRALAALSILFSVSLFGLNAERSLSSAPTAQPSWTPTDVPTITPTSLDELALPAPLCALETGRLVCYHELHHATPVPISPVGQIVSDFALAPDGDWVAYRVGNTLMMGSTTTPTGLGAPRVIDANAPFPDFVGVSNETIAWSPDSLTLVYVTAFGFRTTTSSGQTLEVTNRPYIALRWSPDGTRLATQTVNGGWVFFAFTPNPSQFQITRMFSEPADAAWISATAVVLAPRQGGLLQLDVSSADSPPAWSIATEHFVKLESGEAGQVIALDTQPGASTGTAVGITNSGQWTPFGKAAVDLQMAWGPPLTDQMVYITSGTPIMTDRATGEENMLPFQQVARLAWSPSTLAEVTALPMGADLYFVATDRTDVPQVWRLPGDGSPLIEITHGSEAVIDYQIGTDAIYYVTAGGVGTITNLTGATATPTPGRTLTPTPGRNRPRPSVTPVGTLTPTPTITPFVTITPAPLVTQYTLRSVGWQPGPSLVVRVSADGTTSPAVLIGNPTLSPKGDFAFGFRGTQLVVLNWVTGKEVVIGGVQNPTLIRWVG